MTTSEHRAAIVYNPIKIDIKKLKKAVAHAEESAGWGKSHWFETSEDDWGQGGARRSLAARADVVIAAGGDGTVRAVGEGLRDSGVPLALLPSGTGNLLARNLDLPLNSIEQSLLTAFTGVDRRIDLGIAEITRADGHVEEHAFLVMAGLGLDAKMIAMTDSKLKKAVGWLAYVDAGVRAIPSLKPVRLRYSANDGPEKHLDVHTILIGNCGTLPGGILLIPDAKPDDGLIDIVALRPQGKFGWLRVWRKVAWENGVLRKTAAGRRIIDLSKDVKDVSYFQCTTLQISVDVPQEFQLDGDEFGEAKSVRTWVDAGGLAVKVPA
ncbi:MAG: diacylglycerol kinase family protein [Lacisediminihabitans sp.]